MAEATTKKDYFHPDRGEFRSTAGAGPRGSVGLVISRSELCFSSFKLKTRRRLSTAALLKLQSSITPFPDTAVNMIYEIVLKGEREFLSWTAAADIPDVGGTRELFPESLIFHCRPQDLERYRVFVFRRDPGFEILFWQFPRFYSLFAENEAAIPAQLLSLLRHCGVKECPEILSDIQFPSPRRDIRVSVTSPTWGYLFLPRHTKMKRRYSRFNESLRTREKHGRIRFWTRVLNILALLLAAGILVELGFFIQAKKDGQKMSRPHEETVRILSDVNQLELQFRKRSERLRSYPDHLHHLKAVCSALDRNAFLTDYSVKKGKLEISGYAPDSLVLVRRLRQVPGFSEVHLRNQVTRDPKAERERFRIDITVD